MSKKSDADLVVLARAGDKAAEMKQTQQKLVALVLGSEEESA